MTPTEAEHLRDLFMEARRLTREAQRTGHADSYAEDDAAVEAFNTALREYTMIHAYAAAGFVVCGLETGGAISRHDGYRGPRLRTTSNDAEVTCPKCLEALAP